MPTRTRLIFLQHEEEAWNQIGTARLAHLSLPNSLLLEGRDFKECPRLVEALAERDSVLLYPSRDAVALEELDASPRNLVVIDGTWAQAHNVVNHTPALRGLTRVRLSQGAKSRYRIRLQPRAECLSTLEAAVRALAALEGGAERFEPLLAAFDRMIDRHIARAEAAGRSIIRDLRAERARRPLPDALRGDLEELVIVHGETLNRRDPGTGRLDVDLVQWSALRPATGEVFDELLAPAERTVTSEELDYLGLGSFEGARDAASFRAAWARFARPEDGYLSWGFYASNAFGRLLGRRLAPHTDLRRATKHVLNRKVRRPEEALLELDVGAPTPIARGRAGGRLAALREIVFTLRGLSAVATAR